MTKGVPEFEDRVFRAYPQLCDRMEPFAVVEKSTRTPEMIDDDGNEIIVALTYTVSVFDYTPEDVDNRVSELTDIYNRVHIQNIGNVRGFQLSNGMYSSQITISMKVDSRGYIYPR